jgi:hypothetical protein
MKGFKSEYNMMTVIVLKKANVKTGINEKKCEMSRRYVSQYINYI